MARRSKIRTHPSRKGQVRKAAGVKKGQKIPVSKLQSMKSKARTTKRKRQLQFAINARKWKKK